MVDYDEAMRKINKNSKNMTNFVFFWFFIDPGGQGAIQEGSEPIPELKTMKNIFLENWLRSNEITPYFEDPKLYTKGLVLYD